MFSELFCIIMHSRISNYAGQKVTTRDLKNIWKTTRKWKKYYVKQFSDYQGLQEGRREGDNQKEYTEYFCRLFYNLLAICFN